MHTAKQIFDAITAAVTGLATTGNRVEQTRGYPVGRLPALTVQVISSNPERTLAEAYIDERLDVEVLAHVAGSADTLDDQLFQIHAEIYSAVMANRSLGLPFVIDTEPGAFRVENQDGAETPTAMATVSFSVSYRHPRATVEA